MPAAGVVEGAEPPELEVDVGRVVEVGTVEVGAVVPGALELGLMKESVSHCCKGSHDVTYMHCE